MKPFWILIILIISIPIIYFNMKTFHNESNKFDNSFKMDLNQTVKEFNNNKNKSKNIEESNNTKSNNQQSDILDQQIKNFDQEFEKDWKKF